MSADKLDLCSMLPAELTARIVEDGYPKFRAAQVISWLAKGADIAGMRNLPNEMRAGMAEKYITGGVRIEKTLSGARQDTFKYIFSLSDGNVVEGVLMKYNYGNTMCISSQVGCGMGCAFCASTIDGVVRNLTAGEMSRMAAMVNAQMAEGGKRGVTNIVIMGSGEPLANYDNVVRFLRLVSAPELLGISPRNISLSTCGLVPMIYRLMDEELPITLAISLHAPNNDIRSQIMPINRQYPIEEVLRACVEYIKRTKRRIVFEYALIDGLNSETRHAEELASILRGMMCHINLIPLNRVAESPLLPAGRAKVEAFEQTLTRLGMSATVRRSMGSDISGACGQLRRSWLAGREHEAEG